MHLPINCNLRIFYSASTTRKIVEQFKIFVQALLLG
jgi:hypothetical protein